MKKEIKTIYGILILVILLLAFLILAYFYKPLPLTTILPESNLAALPGSGNVIEATSCNQDAVQTAINQVQDGGTVIIPNGRCTWDSGITLTKQIKLTGESKGGVELIMGSGIVTWDNGMIVIHTGSSYNTEISNLEFWPGTGTGTYIVVWGGNSNPPPLIHDNLFTSDWRPFHAYIYHGRFGGVIYNNTFQSIYKTTACNGNPPGCTADLRVAGRSIQVKGQGEVSWASPSTMGTDDTTGGTNLYIEDNTFIHAGAVDPSGGARVVIRNNVVNNSSIPSHGADTEHWGMRHVEIYDNQFLFNQSGTWTLYDIDGNPVTGDYPLNLQAWWGMRGGTGVVTGNVMPNIFSQWWGDKAEILLEIHNADRVTTVDPCSPNYPVYHQVGRGYVDGFNPQGDLEPAYIWGNSNAGHPDPLVWAKNAGYGQCPDNPHRNNPSHYIQQNRDYYTGVAKPGWTRYPYPHPLRTGVTPPPRSPGPSDADGDGVADNRDRCPDTPALRRSQVNRHGCPKPKTITTLDIKPDLESDISDISNLELGKSNIGKVRFNQNVNLVRNSSELDIDTNLTFFPKKVILNSTNLPELNKPATITLYNITETNPKILKDGQECTQCVINAFSDSANTITFTVPGFSTYEVVEGNTPPVIVAQIPSSSGSSRSTRSGSSSSSQVVCPKGSIYSPTTGKRCTTFTNYSFKRDLTIGSRGEDVKQLQQYLNNNGFPIASSGDGSKGRETTYFGPATRNALIKFQQAKKITPSAGYFGSKSRLYIQTN